MDLRLVFMGSPEFALPSLKALASAYPVVGIVTQPDRPSGRGRVLTPPPVKRLADELHLSIIQPLRLKEPEAMAQLQAWAPDLIIVAAFGQILRQPVLDLPRFGCINVHASLLPRWRGAAPIQAAILSGDPESGVTIMCMDPGVDTGPILSQRPTPILAEDTSGSLSQRLAQLGAELLIESLPPYLQGRLIPREQDGRLATLAPMLSKEDGLLDLSQSAEALARRVKAFQPWPGAFMDWEGAPLKILHARPVSSKPGTVGRHLVLDGYPALQTGQGLLVLEDIQPAGKKPMAGDAFLRGTRNWVR